MNTKKTKEQRIIEVSKAISRLKEIYPDTEVIIETTSGTNRVKVSNMLCFLGMNDELVIDAE